MHNSAPVQLSHHLPHHLGELAVDDIFQLLALYHLHLQLKARDIADDGRENPVPAGIGRDPCLSQGPLLPDTLIERRLPVALGKPAPS